MSSLDKESAGIFIAFILLSAILSAPHILAGNLSNIPKMAVFSFLILGISILSRKIMASMLDANAEHMLWHIKKYGLRQKDYFEKEVPAGIIVPILTAIITLGSFPFLAFLTYEAGILRRRASKRFGQYSYTEMTDWHNSLIGAAGIISLLILAVMSYLLDYGILARISILYALANMFPLSNLDGTQIFFGSRVLWATLAVTTLIFFAYSVVLI